jgi:hypothetical protein
VPKGPARAERRAARREAAIAEELAKLDSAERAEVAREREEQARKERAAPFEERRNARIDRWVNGL